jgi:hypothetical protein
VLERSLRLGELQLQVFHLLGRQTRKGEAVMDVLNQIFEIGDM